MRGLTNGLRHEHAARVMQRVFALSTGASPEVVYDLVVTDGWRQAASQVVAMAVAGRDADLKVEDVAAFIHRAFCRGSDLPLDAFADLPFNHRRAWERVARIASYMTQCSPEDLKDTTDAELVITGHKELEGDDE